MTGSLSKMPEPSLRYAIKAAGMYGALFVVQAMAMKRALIDSGIPYVNAECHPYLGVLPSMMKNILRRQEWYVEITRGKKMSWFSGIFFDPNGIEICMLDSSVVKHVLKDNSSNYTK